MLCYQLGVVDVPPRHRNARDHTLEQRLRRHSPAGDPPERAALPANGRDHVRPKTVEGRAATLRIFAGWLAEVHPQVGSLRRLTQAVATAG